MRHFLFVMAVAGASVSLASPLSPDQALSRLDMTAFTRSGNPHLVYQVANNDQPAVYVFNNDGSGFMIVSADDVASPLLGYSGTGSFDPANIAPGMKWWLGEYARQIAFAVETGVPEVSATRGGTRADFGPIIPVMLKTKWNQGTPYNNQCPVVNDMHCVTGCVATAMAQVMNYHRFPEVGKGEVSVTVGPTYETLKLDLSTEKFDWTNMLDVYNAGEYTDEQADAVAYLMKACGYSVDMDYTTSESGAVSFDIGSALINNFGYNPYITYEERDYYNETSWGQMVYDELAANRPVIYGGRSEGGGHQFVCDGYDGNGYFHINWGWGGVSDGYFLLQSLNPNDLGIGGGTGGGYSFEQSIIKDVQPQMSDKDFVPQLSQSTNIKGNSTSTAIINLQCSNNGGWWNYAYKALTINMGVIIESLDNPSAEKHHVIGSYNGYKLEKVTLEPLHGFRQLTFTFPTALPDGRYKATLATQNAEVSDAEWIPVKCPEYYSNFTTITKKGTSYKLEYEDVKSLSVVDCEFLAPLYSGAYTKFKITVKNETGVELTQTLAPALMKQGDYWYVGDGIPMNVKPGETVTKEVPILFVAQKPTFEISTSTSFSLKIVDMNTSKEIKYSKSVTMEPAIEGHVVISDMTIANATVGEKGGYPQFSVDDPSNIDYSAKVNCQAGYFGEQLWIAVLGMKGDLLSYQPVAPVVTLSEGEECTVGANIYFGQAAPGEDYVIGLCHLVGNTLYLYDESQIILSIGSAAVDGVEADSELVSVAVYSLNGQLVSRSTSAHGNFSAGNRSNLSSGIHDDLPAGIYIVKTTLSDGTVKTEKIIR